MKQYIPLYENFTLNENYSSSINYLEAFKTLSFFIDVSFNTGSNSNRRSNNEVAAYKYKQAIEYIGNNRFEERDCTAFAYVLEDNKDSFVGYSYYIPNEMVKYFTDGFLDPRGNDYYGITR